MSDFMAKMHQI